ncbi:hypothetical protein EZV62_015525 [Acer yangbiense]|uniref:Integrase catalytic domain-containing protein n=1 Tax=Acer yangbiense TaxID=1000413 RepID=A0A5C7HN15_9ROSI|nr:hypothetical protein EZV62_015525 [Acer yangbiense]
MKSSCTSGKECRDATLTTDVSDTGDIKSIGAQSRDNMIYFSKFPISTYNKKHVVDEKSNCMLSHSTCTQLNPCVNIVADNCVQNASMNVKDSATLWHNKLGHPSSKILKQILRQMNVSCNVSNFDWCDACKLGKMHQLPYNRSEIKSKSPLEMVYTDIWGPSPMVSATGHKYYISFVDDYTQFTWLFPIVLKSEAFPIFLKFKKHVELQFHTKIRVLQSNMGMEYQSFASSLQQFGIVHRFSCAYTHQQNGVPERKHRHIVETGLTLLAQAKLSLKFWTEAFNAAVILINNLPTSVLKGISLFQALYNKKSNYSYFKAFGCSCFPYTRPYSHVKFGFHYVKCVFIGYSSQHKGYKCLSPTSKVFISKNVLFHEFEFPYLELFPSQLSPAMPPTSGPVLSLSFGQSPTDFVPTSIRASSGTAAAVMGNSGVVENVNALPARVPSSNPCPTSTHGMVTRSKTSKECRDATLTTDVSDTGQAHTKSAAAPTNTRVPNDDLVTRSLPHFRNTSRVKDRSQDRFSATHQTLKRTQING